MVLFIFENSELFLGVLPESLAMLVFGISLIALAVGMRWFLTRFEDATFPEEEPVRNFVGAGETRAEFLEAHLSVNEE